MRASERTRKKKCPKDICFVGLASGIMMLSLQKLLIIIISFVHARALRVAIKMGDTIFVARSWRRWKIGSHTI